MSTSNGQCKPPIMSDVNDDVSDQMQHIDFRLSEIDEQIEALEVERASLLQRRHEYNDLLKDIAANNQPSVSREKNCTAALSADPALNWNRTDFTWSERVNACLKDVFHLSSFRPLQLETINATLSKRDCILVIPTGGGKSLCFQLPALIDTGVTLVVSPLISLVEDQMWTLQRLRIRADTLNGSSTKEHVKLIHEAMLDAESDLKILYVTPEKLAKSKMFMNKLEKMYDLGRFTRLVIDEVHCCSTYGHDFRPDYKFLGVMRRLFPKICMLGLTATATQSVIEDVVKILNVDAYVLFKASFNRPNIYYEVRNKPANHDDCMVEISGQIRSRFAQQSGIVYCFSQRESEQVAADLCSRGVHAAPYHAQLGADARSQVHERWVKNKVHVIVATIAFGMGIDKGDCRFVIHHSLSKSLENFYQESGRAGRDGQTAHSILYYRFADIFRQSSLVFTEQTGLTNLYSIVNYCIDRSCCRRNLIAKYFNDSDWMTKGACNLMCDHCDVAKSIGPIAAASATVTTLVDCIKEATLVIDLLYKHSVKETRLTANKLAELVFSELNAKNRKAASASAENNELSQLDVEELILNMLMRKHLKEDFHFTPYSTIVYLVPGDRKLAAKFEIRVKRLPSKRFTNVNNSLENTALCINKNNTAQTQSELLKKQADSSEILILHSSKVQKNDKTDESCGPKRKAKTNPSRKGVIYLDNEEEDNVESKQLQPTNSKKKPKL